MSRFLGGPTDRDHRHRAQLLRKSECLRCLILIERADPARAVAKRGGGDQQILCCCGCVLKHVEVSTAIGVSAGRSFRIPANHDRDGRFRYEVLPEGSGGLLPTLYLWRRLAVQGPGAYGDVYYLGTVPLDGHDDLTDVLVGVHGGVECRFFFDRTEGFLLAIEMSPDEEVDPCEVYFREYRQVGDRWIPGKMEIRHGNDVFGFLPVDRFDFGTAAGKSA